MASTLPEAPEERAGALRRARLGLAIALLLALLASLVSTTLFVILKAFDADGITMLAGGLLSYFMAGCIAVRIFLGEIR